jgi:PAS domain S-box-containing protein
MVVAHDITQRKRAEESILSARIALERQNQRLSALYEAAQLVNSTLDFDEVLDFVVEAAMRTTHAAHGLALLVNQTDKTFEWKAFRGFRKDEEDRARGIRLGLDQGLNGRAYQTRDVVVVDDVTGQPDYYNMVETTRSELVIPIQREGTVLGNIDLQSPDFNAFHNVDMAYLKALTEQASLAITNARLYRELESYNEFLEQAVNERTSELMATKDRVETILSSVGDGLMVLNIDGRIQQVNSAFERQTGYSTAEAEMRDHHTLLHLEFGSKGDYKSALEMLLPGQVWMGETKVQRKDSSVFDASLTIAPVRDDQDRIKMLVASIRDITPLKEVERAKDAFVSNVSHELRTPITSLRLTHDLMRRDPSRMDVFMQRLERDIDRLNLLIEDLLRLSRLEQDRTELNLQPVDLNGLVAQYYDDRTPLAANKGLTLTLERAETIPLVQADSGLLGQVLSVLLTNAFNYTPKGGTVTISSHTRDHGSRRWAGFSVGDTGPGISPAEHGQLFTRFYRGTVGRDSGATGTGLGLAIAKEIIDRHAGRIEIVSEGIPGKGATFIVWLPAGTIKPTTEDTA